MTPFQFIVTAILFFSLGAGILLAWAATGMPV